MPRVEPQPPTHPGVCRPSLFVEGGRDVTRSALRVPSGVVLIGRLAVGANTVTVLQSRSLTSSQANVKPETGPLLPSVSGTPSYEVAA